MRSIRLEHQVLDHPILGTNRTFDEPTAGKPRLELRRDVPWLQIRAVAQSQVFLIAGKLPVFCSFDEPGSERIEVDVPSQMQEVL